ncbi:MAG: hypothetical protein ACJA1U_001029 [Bermanella sp.]|jgi:hypothetical protein
MPKAKKTQKVDHNDAIAAVDQPDMEFIGSAEEGVLRSIASRQKLRSKMDNEIEAFLKKGGSINEIEPNVMADPPRKPTSNYGSRPI